MESDHCKIANWEFLNRWSIHALPFETHSPIPHWEQLESFIGSAAKVSELIRRKVVEMHKKSDILLKDFDGDPLNTDWKKFRPLRLSREEDWSDWLAFLIENSLGWFNQSLLERSGFTFEDYLKPRVEREVSSGGYRSDIIILWRNKHADHLEVKIGDPDLEKTYGTSAAMRKRYGEMVTSWHDWILLLEGQIYDWQLTSEKVSSNDTYKDISIKPITWIDVAVAIRWCLYNKKESIQWRSWAFAFTGAIETTLCEIRSSAFLSQRRNVFHLTDSVQLLETIYSRSMNDGDKESE